MSKDKYYFPEKSATSNKLSDSSSILNSYNYASHPNLSEPYLTSYKKWGFFTLLISLGIYIVANNHLTIFCFFLTSFIFIQTIIAIARGYLFFKGIKRKNLATTKYTYSLQEKQLPSYSIIVPLYKEATIIKQLIYYMSRIDYPRNLLTIHLVLEEDDHETIEALQKNTLPSHFKTIIVPFSHPRTKPKACNYALQHINSDLLVIYDAEDAPDPMQLQKVANFFHTAPNETVCVQCGLHFSNGNKNWLCAMFSLEYRILFGYIIPALDMLKLPIPLGGSSNHFIVKKLKYLGGWDPFNVTEDAELGIRISRNNMKVSFLYSTTEEESPRSIKVWLKQRTRWIKGYIQTYYKHITSANSFVKDIGWKQWFWITCIIILASTSHIATALIFFALTATKLSNLVPAPILKMYYLSMVLGTIALIYTSYKASNSSFYNVNSKEKFVWWSYPIYFILHSLAAVRAVYQLLYSPYLWEKTPHELNEFIKR